MRSQKPFNTKYVNDGMLLVDVMIGLALAGFFTVLITQSYYDSQEVFEYARERDRLLDIYDAHAAEFSDMKPYEQRSLIVSPTDNKHSTTTISASARWYGNERVETDIEVSATSTALHGLNKVVSVGFNAIRNYPFPDLATVTGTPLCATQFSENSPVVGSYQYTHLKNIQPRDVLVSITPIPLPINPALPLTDIEIRNGTAYISTDSSVATDPDLIIVDISDAHNPNVLSSLNTGPGISSIALADDHIYAAAASTAAQLHVIKLIGFAQPVLEKKFQIPLPYATATPPMGTSIAYRNKHVYLGTDRWVGDEFSIIDVANPATPFKVGGYNTESKINDILLEPISGTTAYISDSVQQQLRAIDISNSANPLLVNHFDPSGWERQEGNTSWFFEGSLNFGRTSGGFNITKDAELFGWPSSSSTYPVSISNDIPQSADISGGVYGIITDRSFTYVASRTSGKEFMIFDRDLSTTTMKSVSLPAPPQILTCDRNHLYVLAHNSPIMYDITISNEQNIHQ